MPKLKAVLLRNVQEFEELFEIYPELEDYIGVEAEVLCEATDDYWDIRFPDGFVVDAISSYHLGWIK